MLSLIYAFLLMDTENLELVQGHISDLSKVQRRQHAYGCSDNHISADREANSTCAPVVASIYQRHEIWHLHTICDQIHFRSYLVIDLHIHAIRS